MIFDSSKMGAWIADIFQRDASTNGAQFSSSRVVIYQGTQPSIADFEANWSTDYWLNDAGTTGTASSNVLCAYGNMWGASSTHVGLSRAGNLLNLGSGIPTSYYFNPGTAAWAMIVPYYNSVANESGSIIPFSQSSNPVNFILAPVSDSLGTAPVQLGTVAINGSAPTLVALGLEINVGA